MHLFSSFSSNLVPNLLLFSIKTAALTLDLRLSNNTAPMICWSYCNIYFLNVQSNNSSPRCLHSTHKRGVEGVLSNVDYNNFNLISLIYNHWLLAKSTIPPWNKLNWPTNNLLITNLQPNHHYIFAKSTIYIIGTSPQPCFVYLNSTFFRVSLNNSSHGYLGSTCTLKTTCNI